MRKEDRMGKIESVVKAEVARLARREVRAVLAPLKGETRRLKTRVSELAGTVGELRRQVRESVRLTRIHPRTTEAGAPAPGTSRLSAGLIKKLRKRLGISQAQLATLVGVSAVAIQFWESGRTRPNEENRTAVVALRKLGRRDVKLLLEKAEREKRPKKAAKKKTRKTAAKKKATKPSGKKRARRKQT